MATPPLSVPRKRVSQACKNCGIKKIKCDGTLPACTPCQHRAIECEYGISKRSSRSLQSPHPRTNLQPASNPNILRDERLVPLDHPAPPGDRLVTRAATKPTALSMNVPPEISARLFQNYFNYIHPLWPILYKPLYASLDYAAPTNMMPAALVSAVFATAACIDKPQTFATNTIVQRYPEPNLFFEEAIELLQQGPENNTPRTLNALVPSILNCQVLTILGLQQHGVAEYSRAGILCGLAASMAIELRLHRPDVSGDPIQGEVRSRLWWNLYILDKMMSFEMCRPVILRSEEMDCPLPSTSEADEFELMSTYARDQSLLEQVRNTSIKLRTISGLHKTVSLSMIMERICREIYGLSARKSMRQNQTVGEAKRNELWEALLGWEKEMQGSPLRLDLSEDLASVPATIINHVIMCTGTIMLHRPFIARWESNPSVSEASRSPHEVCLEAANSICFVLEKYFDRLPGLPCDMLFSIFSAASTLFYQSKQTTKNDGFETRHRLKLCIHWLSVLGKSWKSAGARQQLLVDMFDLPSDLNAPLNGNQMEAKPQHAPYGSNHAQLPSFSAVNGSPGRISQPQPAEDWSFLREFGDASDDFYTLDVEFRGLLERRFSNGTDFR